jgi:hypothetical protein
MPFGRRAGKLHTMEPRSEPVRVTLEIERGAEPLQGGIEDGSGPRRSFVGWRGLAAALTAILERDEQPPP